MVMYAADLIDGTEEDRKNKCIIEENFQFESFPKTCLARNVLLVFYSLIRRYNDGFCKYCTMFEDFGQFYQAQQPFPIFYK